MALISINVDRTDGVSKSQMATAVRILSFAKKLVCREQMMIVFFQATVGNFLFLKSLLVTTCLIVSAQLQADPIQYVDDWDTMNEMTTTKIMDKITGISVEFDKNGDLLLSKEKQSTTVSLPKGTYEGYILNPEMSDDNKHDLRSLLFNRKLRETLFVDIEWMQKTSNLKKTDWNFGFLEGVFANCTSDYEVLYEELKTSYYFISKLQADQRTKEYKCSYFLGGGRCYLSMDPSSGKEGYYDKLVLDQNFNYVGDLTSIEQLLNAGCDFKKRLMP